MKSAASASTRPTGISVAGYLACHFTFSTMRRFLLVLLCCFLFAAGWSQTRFAGLFSSRPTIVVTPDPKYPQPKPVTGKPDEFPVRKTEAEWRQQLTPAQYFILRENGTERPFANKYHNLKEEGNYYCAADHNLLFSSERKFDSGTGWPSFWAPAAEGSLKVKSDHSFGMSRDAVLCAQCGGHLGHVFNDGPAPTGLRYCIDSDALVFEKK